MHNPLSPQAGISLASLEAIITSSKIDAALLAAIMMPVAEGLSLDGVLLTTSSQSGISERMSLIPSHFNQRRWEAASVMN